MNWLTQLPHQFPFRAASAVRRVDEKTIEGVFLCTSNDYFPNELMLVEAMAQFAGGLVFHVEQGAGYLTGIDRCEVLRAIVPGDEVTISCTLEVAFGGTYRFSGIARADGVDVARGRFYLASPAAEQAGS